MNPSIRTSVAQGCWFVGGVIAVFSASALISPSTFLPSASAAVPACISDGDYGAMAAIEDPNNATSNDIHGTRVDVFVPLGPTSCQRISSVYVYSQNFNGAFEFGWVIGYSNCNGSTYAHPHLFWWAVQQSTGGKTCGVFSSPVPSEDQYDTFRVSDTNANTWWGSYFNGTDLQPNGVNMDFSSGWSVVGMERGASADSGYARWNSLEEYHDGNAWSYWDNASLLTDQDPAYHFNRIDAHTASFAHD